MSELRVVTALRSEFLALRGHVDGARLERCGMGPARVAEWLPSLSGFDHGALVVAGVAGGLSYELRAGDVVVASEVRDAHGRTVLRAAAPLAAELRAMGLRVHVGPIVSSDTIVSGAERERLAATGALAVDMESAAIVREIAPTSERQRDVCVAVVRVIVDTAHMPLARVATVGAGIRALQVLRKTGPAYRRWAELAGPRTVLLAGPRSFCAGVDRAIDIVERALRRYPRPVYVRRQIVHNAHVVSDLERQGAVFVDELDEVPDDTTVVFSAHGVAPSVRAEADRRHLTVVDATCPLVAKVHTETRRFLGRGDSVVLIGHDGHDETEGTLGEGRDGEIHLVGSAADVAALEIDDPARVSYVMQTTLAVDEANEIVDELRTRFPLIQSSPSEDICYATSNRQAAVRAVASDSDVVIVVGSQNSSNSLRLVEVAERSGAAAFLVDDATEIRPSWIRDARRIGLTAGASAPPHLIDEVVGTLAALGPVELIQREVAREDIRFTLPKEVAH